MERARLAAALDKGDYGQLLGAAALAAVGIEAVAATLAERGALTEIDFVGLDVLAFADEPGWDAAARALDDPPDGVRVVPPLDNLLFSRRRLAELFGFDYKFEAYTPIDQRRFYFAMPLLYRDRLVGVIDAKLDRNGGRPEWRIVGLELGEAVPPDALRTGIHRLARIAGAENVAVTTRAPRDVKRALTGKVS